MLLINFVSFAGFAVADKQVFEHNDAICPHVFNQPHRPDPVDGEECDAWRVVCHKGEECCENDGKCECYPSERWECSGGSWHYGYTEMCQNREPCDSWPECESSMKSRFGEELSLSDPWLFESLQETCGLFTEPDNENMEEMCRCLALVAKYSEKPAKVMRCMVDDFEGERVTFVEAAVYIAGTDFCAPFVDNLPEPDTFDVTVNACPRDLFISSSTECQAAADSLGIKWNSCCQNNNNLPYGCLKRSDGDVIWNGKASARSHFPCNVAGNCDHGMRWAVCRTREGNGRRLESRLEELEAPVW